MTTPSISPDPIAIRSLSGVTRWLLEVFELGGWDRPWAPASGDAGPDSMLRRHAVWLRLGGDQWCWWCCCGARSDPGSDLVAILTTARMHFDALHAWDPTPIAHPIAAWRDRVGGQPAGDDLAVAGLAWKIAESVGGSGFRVG